MRHGSHGCRIGTNSVSWRHGDNAVTINLTIDGMPVEAREGSSILEAINASGTYIPQLCKDPAMPAIGACRTCLVQVEGRRGFPASCHTPVSEGMVVQTNSPEVRRIRQGVLDLTLGMLPTETPGQPLAEHKELKTASRFHDLLTTGYETRARDHTDSSNPFFSVEMDDCILCGRCVEACQDLQQIGAIAMLGRGQDAFIGTYGDEPIAESICTSCGSCVAACPTGAIEPKLDPDQRRQADLHRVPLLRGRVRDRAEHRLQRQGPLGR